MYLCTVKLKKHSQRPFDGWKSALKRARPLSGGLGVPPPQDPRTSFEPPSGTACARPALPLSRPAPSLLQPYSPFPCRQVKTTSWRSRRRTEELEYLEETEAAVSLVGGGAMLASDWGLLASMSVGLYRA